MTLRESANSFIKSVNLAVVRDVFRSEDFSSKTWNCLHSDVAKKYILESFDLLNRYKDCSVCFYHDMNNVCSLRITKRKTKISELKLDDEFDWGNITLS